MIKAVVVLQFLLFAISAEGQRAKVIGDLHFQLSVDVVNVATGEQLDTFDIVVSSNLGSLRFNSQGSRTQLIMLDSSAFYSVKVTKEGLSIAEYSWSYSVEEGNYIMLHVRLYPEDFTAKQSERALKRYKRDLKKKSVDKTCNGLHWFHDVYI